MPWEGTEKRASADQKLGMTVAQSDAIVIFGARSLSEYDPNTWGPREADRLIGGDGWHNPGERT
jgi:hypothetical protein